jgi:hypothetical protein
MELFPTLFEAQNFVFTEHLSDSYCSAKQPWEMLV